MMALFLGEEVLRKGVSKYLIDHQYGNADKDDLLNSLTEQAHTDMVLDKNLTVKQIMDTWTLQTGYPIITATRDCDKHIITFSQSRFLREGYEVRDEKSSCWWVPISYTTGEELNFNFTEPKHWLPCPKTTVEAKIDNCNSWHIVNIQAAGKI